MLSHCGVFGNEAPDTAAIDAHNSSVQVAIPLSRSDRNAVTSTLAKDITKFFWNTETKEKK